MIAGAVKTRLKQQSILCAVLGKLPTDAHLKELRFLEAWCNKADHYGNNLAKIHKECTEQHHRVLFDVSGLTPLPALTAIDGPDINSGIRDAMTGRTSRSG